MLSLSRKPETRRELESSVGDRGAGAWAVMGDMIEGAIVDLGDSEGVLGGLGGLEGLGGIEELGDIAGITGIGGFLFVGGFLEGDLGIGGALVS